MLGILLQCFLFFTLVAGKANATKMNVREVYVDFSEMVLSLFAMLNEIETEFSFVNSDDYLNKGSSSIFGSRSYNSPIYYSGLGRCRITQLRFRATLV